MIRLTRLDNKEFLVNPDLIEFIEEMPNTILSLRTEKKIIVKETLDEVLRRITDFKRSIHSTPYFQKGEKMFINSDTPDLFFLDKKLKDLKNIKDIHDIDPDEEWEEE